MVTAEGAPMIFPLPKTYIPREETCPVCKKNLAESFGYRSSAPKDRMTMIIGREYPSFLRSKGVYCPDCKIDFRHPMTESQDIESYLETAKEGGWCTLVLLQPFVVELFQTELTSDLPAGTVLYTKVKHVREVLEKKEVWLKGESVMRIKDGYKKSDGITDSAFGMKGLAGYKEGYWDSFPAMRCTTKIEDLLSREKYDRFPVEFIEFPADFALKEKI